MANTINLLYAKKADYNIIRPIIDAGIGIAIMTGSVKLLEGSKMGAANEIIFGSMIGSLLQTIASFPFIPDNSKTYKIVGINNGITTIESYLSGYNTLPALLPAAGVLISMFSMIKPMLFGTKQDVTYEKAIIQFGLPIVGALWKEYEFHGEKLYTHRCIDPYKTETKTHYAAHNGELTTYSTRSFATDNSKELRYLGDDQFEILHYGEAVEILIVKDIARG